MSHRCAALMSEQKVAGGQPAVNVSRCLSLVFVLCLLLAGCTRAAVPTTVPALPPTSPSTEPVPTAVLPPSPTPAMPAPSPTFRERYEVQMWFHDPEPQQGDTVLMFGSLLQNGFAIGGDIMMQATWPDRYAPGGHAVCWDRPNYARGICYVKVTEQYPPGVSVPITVTMHVRWLKARFVGHTSFTPR